MSKETEPKPTEIEIKYRLESAKSLLAVETALGIQSSTQRRQVLRQVNYFFDTKDFLLKKANLALRLRQENEQFILCAKGTATNGPKTPKSAATRFEYEEKISKALAMQMLADKVSPVQKLEEQTDKLDPASKTRLFLLGRIGEVAKQKSLRVVGSFTNIRTCLPIRVNGQVLTLELDETTFPGHVIHYEVELELPQDSDHELAERVLCKLFDKAGVKYSPSEGKSDRLFKMLKAQ